MRLDVYLFLCGLARSRTHAANLIKLGKVSINGLPANKVSLEVEPQMLIEVSQTDDYASLGGLKLHKALDDFCIEVKDKIAIDIGASNGGFTDVLLKRKAAKVYAVDVGECALPPNLVSDDRVKVKDRLNARYLTFEDIGVKADIIVVDVSFISLKLVVPALLQFLKPSSSLVALIKPQFEAGKKSLTKSGIVANNKTLEKIVKDISDFCISIGFTVKGITQAPKPFADKNQEYLIHCSLS